MGLRPPEWDMGHQWSTQWDMRPPEWDINSQHSGTETTRMGHGTSMVNTVGLRLPEWNMGHHGQHSGT